MSKASAPRRVLVIEDEPSIRNTLYVLLAALECESDVAYSGKQALAMIARQSFDAVLLDLRCADVPAEQVIARIREIRPNLLGRVLFITGEVSDPQAMEVIERSCARHVSRGHLMQEVWEHLRGLLGQPESPSQTA